MENEKSEKPEVAKTFREFHNDVRKLRYRVFMDPRKNGKHSPYVRPKAPGEIKGKKAIRAAKREKVKAMKATQAV